MGVTKYFRIYGYGLGNYPTVFIPERTVFFGWLWCRYYRKDGGLIFFTTLDGAEEFLRRKMGVDEVISKKVTDKEFMA